MTAAWLALGGNVGDTRALLDRAVSLLGDGITLRPTARSSDYQTPPWGLTEQAPFVNLCIEVETTLSSRKLLARAHDVERSLGRNRAYEQRWGPRTVDIDIIAYDNLTIQEGGLIERAFVLIPLAEIAPDLQISGKRIADAAAAIDSAGVVRLPLR
jgi:2-amino-4-hydroxy-6-hydroxymethyldihydropteridine diphosphokinase